MVSTGPRAVRQRRRSSTLRALPCSMVRLRLFASDSLRRLCSLLGVRQRQTQMWPAARLRRRTDKATPPVAPRKKMVLVEEDIVELSLVLLVSLSCGNIVGAKSNVLVYLFLVWVGLSESSCSSKFAVEKGRPIARFISWIHRRKKIANSTRPRMRRRLLVRCGGGGRGMVRLARKSIGRLGNARCEDAMDGLCSPRFGVGHLARVAWSDGSGYFRQNDPC